MTPVDLEALEAAEVAATPGPWDNAGQRELVWAQGYGLIADSSPLSTGKADLNLVVLLRNSCPAIIEELKRLRAENKELRWDGALNDANAEIARLKAANQQLRDTLVRVGGAHYEK